MIRERDSSPWGQIQSVTEIVPGIAIVSTSSHGGIWLDPEHAARVPAEIVNKSFLEKANWWEEDCDWCIPFVIFEAEIMAYGDHQSRVLIERGIHKEAFAKFKG